MELRLLGPVELRVAGRPVEIGGPRQRSVVAALAVDAGRPVPVDALIDRVWGDDPPRRVRHALHVYIARLRGLLARAGTGIGTAPARVLRGRGGYIWETNPEQIDIHRFQRLVDGARAPGCPDRQRAGLLGQAVNLWRGPLLGDLAGDWATRVRQGWQQRYLEAVVSWAEACLRAGEPGAALVRLVELTSEHPLVEPAAAAYLRALYAAGRAPDALDHYARLRRLLAEELGTDPGPELRRLHRQILTGDPQLAGPGTDAAARVAPAGAAPAGAAPAEATVAAQVPRQLPAPPPVFTGRAGELARLKKMPDAATAVVTAIDGMAGVGKTALALHAAHRLAARYPDGQLFVDLCGHTDGLPPLDPADALDRLLRALGLPGEQVPAPLAERAALYRSRLAERRMVILLDNAAAEAQVAPLLPGAPGCLVLVTSRRRLAGLDQTHTVSLDMLPLADAVTLFTRTAGAGRVAGQPAPLLAETAQLCGRLPLALRVAAARLRAHPTWDVAYLAGRLRDHRHRLAELAAGDRSVTAALDLSYRQLDPATRRGYRLLGLHPGPDFDGYAAAALTGTTRPEAERLLEGLLDTHLLQEPTPGRHAFHDLVRAHAAAAAARLPAPDRRAALTRLFDD